VVTVILIAFTGGITVAAEKKFVIGHSMASLRAEWWQIMHQSILEEVKKYPDVKLIWTDSEGKSEKQIADVNDLLLQGIDLLLLFPNESAPLEVAVDAANRKKVPVIAWDKPMREGVGLLAFVAGDHYGIGQNDAKYLVELLTKKYGEPKGKVIEITGEEGTLTVTQRRGGFDDYLAKYPNIKIVAMDTAAWYQDKAYYLTKNFLQAHPDVDAFYYHNDNMALGGVKALEEENLIGKVFIFGVDGDYRFLKAIKEGKGTATSTYSYVLGKMALELGIKYLKGEKIPYKVIMPTYLVNKDNVDQFYDPDFPAYVEPENPAPPVIIWERPEN
jgi:ribose transport system substrate-binding protein